MQADVGDLLFRKPEVLQTGGDEPNLGFADYPRLKAAATSSNEWWAAQPV